MPNIAVMLFVLLISPQVLQAAPQRLADYGQTEETLFANLDPKKVMQNRVPAANWVRALVQSRHYPVVSNKLKPSEYHNKVVRVGWPGVGAVFLIGADYYSTAWLQANRQHLRDLNAKGLVVNVKDQLTFQQLQVLAGDIPLTATSGDDLAKYLNLSYYPVLITEK
jgi:integrating conjugative element protein (TIGR03765 family)